MWGENLVYKIRRNPRPRLGEPEPDPGALVEHLDEGDFEDYIPVFIQENQDDADFWEDDNIADMLGDLE